MIQIPRLSPRRIAFAFLVAGLADFIQLVFTAGFSTVLLFIPSAIADVMVDVGAAVMISLAIGFHWMFLPTFMLEALPFVGALPTWTGCVALVVWQRRRNVTVASTARPGANAWAKGPPAGKVVDVDVVRETPPTISSRPEPRR